MENQILKPGIVIVSSSNTKPKSLLKLITGVNNVQIDEESYVSSEWEIDTKYYTANVNIYGINEEFRRSEEFNNTIEALIIHMDSNKESGLDDVTKWLKIEDDAFPEIKLLLTNYCTEETKITKAKATEWCLKHGFELIELYPAVESIPEDEIIKEKTGVERVIESLETHVWSNLVMKEKHDNQFENSLEEDFLTEQAADDFNELFSQLHMIKESIKSMPTNERKQCAENMVTAFWRAMGGDEEELSDV